MAQPQTVEEAIARNAKGPASVSVAGQTVTQQSIEEQIKADQYLAGKTAASKPQFGLRFSKFIPPAAG